mgnify:CR=1 FL=1|tara:strand:- start:27897 stop:28223 length:327 start_codon:yes stop_codon:yes gene_type:complete
MDKKVYNNYLDIWEDTAPFGRIAELERKLAEANAKIEELTTRLSDAETAGGKEMALHDADVIADFVKAYERNKYEAIKHGGRLSGVAEFGRDYFIKLRNSVKEGEQND